MATTFADLEARVRGLETRAQRAKEDITAIIDTVTETRDDVKGLKRDVSHLKRDVGDLKRGLEALLDYNGINLKQEAAFETKSEPGRS